MKGLLGLALTAILLQSSCSAALAVTWFDSNTRPDGVGDTANVYMAPGEDGAQVVYGGTQDSEAAVSDVFDSGD